MKRQREEHPIMKKSIITPGFEQMESAPPISRSKRAKLKEKKLAKGASVGEKWFDMPAPVLTPSLKQDLKLLRMRNTLDPAHHYKASDMDKQFPRYFQEGRVVAHHADFYSTRIPRKSQKQTMVDELLANEEARQYQLKKYQEFQEKNSSGSHRHKRIKYKRKFKKK